MRSIMYLNNLIVTLSKPAVVLSLKLLRIFSKLVFTFFF